MYLFYRDTCPAGLSAKTQPVGGDTTLRGRGQILGTSYRIATRSPSAIPFFKGQVLLNPSLGEPIRLLLVRPMQRWQTIR